MITSIDQLDLEKRYTYADYLTWQFDDMVELIRGKIFKMSPAPGGKHQQVSGNLYGLIWSYLRKKSCQIFSVPFDVRLPLPTSHQKSNKIDTVVQPDICIICDPSKLDNQGCNGTVIPYRLDDQSSFQPIRNTPFAKGEIGLVVVFEGFEVDLEEVFG